MAFWGKIAKFFIDIGTSFGVKGKLGNIIAGITGFVNVATIVVGVRGFIQARQMLAKGQDILANKTSAGGKIPVIYGTRRVGAQIIYMSVNANDSRDLYVVYALAVGEVDEIIGKSIELDGNRLTDSARFRDGGYIGSDKIASGNYSLNTVSQNGTGIDAGAGQFGSSPTSKYRYVMNLHHGAATQTADPMLVASMSEWTSAHKLNGIAYIACHFGYDKEGIWSGVPQLTVQVRGKKVYDPRLDSTAGGSGSHRFNDVSTYAYSDNPALCFLNYITDNEVGKGLTESQINMSTFSSAANVCDTEVDNPFFGGTSKSLTWSGNSGDGFITIGGSDPNSDWWQNKIGELIDIYDNNGDGVITDKEITDIQRDEFFDQNPLYRVYFNDTLGTNYSSQTTGSSLVKIKRFHCNGYLDTNKNVMDNAKELLANMRGIFLYIDGKYELQIEDTGSSSFTITDDHIIADAGISVDYGNKDKKANKVIVEFFNANKRYELDTATVLHDATPNYYSDDNDEILEIKAEFPYVTDPYIAYNMAKAILVRSRKQMTIQFLGTPEMYKLNVGDIVTLNYVGTFDTSQTCRVEALELQPNGLVAVSLIEYFDVYTWETPPEEPLEELSNLPSAYAVKAPTGLSFTDTDSSSTGRPFLSWNEPTDFPDYQYRVNVVDSSSNQVLNRIVDVENCDLNFIPVNANYVASVTSLNTLGTESDPATLTFSIGDAPTATADIQDDAIVTDKILDGNVTDAKIQSLTANKITAGTIDASVITVTNLDADNITSGTIGADKILVDDLSAINSDLGAIDAGSINIGSGAFTVSSAGVLDATGATIGGSFSSGSGNSIFKADTNGIYLGNATFANAPFKVLSSGEVQTTKSFTAGVAGSSEIAKMSGTGDYRFWSGNETPSNASFSVDKDGKAIAKNLVLKLTDGTVYFDSATGFSSSAISQISTSTGTRVSTVSSTFDSDLEYEEITVTSTTSVNVSVSIDANFGGFASNSSDTTAETESKNDVPIDFTLTIEHSSDGGSNYDTVVTDTFSRVETTPASDEYKINTSTQELFIGSQGGVIYLSTTTTSLNLGCVDSDGRTTLSYTGLSLSGTTSGTTHRIRASVSTSDASYDTVNNNVSSSAPRVLSVTDPSGSGFYVDNGSGSTVPPEGDITAVQITTASSSGLTGGANFTSGDATFTLALASSIDGARTFTNNVVIQGDLDVQGTTTTIDTANLDVKDKNITLNYGTGDTSANANGAGITIQDAVNSTTDATLTWNTSDDSFNFSHDVNVTGTVTASGDLAIDTDTLFVDVSTDRVGINNSSPSYPLDFPTNQSGLAIRVGDDNVDSYIAFSNPRGFVGFDAAGYMTLQGGISKGIRLNVNNSTFGDGAALTIDDSANATFAGTIDSGAINTTGAVTIDVDDQGGGALRIEANQTNPNNDLYFAQEIYSTLSGTTATTADREQGGIYMDINSTATGGDTSNEHRAYGMFIDLDSTGDADLLYGVYSNATATPTTGTTTNVFGGYFHAEDNGGAGNVGTLIGVQGTAVSDNATSDVNAMYGGFFKNYNVADSAAITTSTAVYGEIEIPSGTADIYGTSYIFQAQYDNNGTVAQTNTTYLYYGNYAGVLPTNAYGVYIADAVDNYFGGTISSGAISIANSTTDATLLTVGSSSQTSYSLQNFQTDTLSGNTAYLIAYGTGNPEDGNFAMKNTNTGGNIFFQVGTATPLTLTTTGADFGSGIDVTGTVTADGLTVDTTTLVVDSANNRVGIGTTSPDADLHISSAGGTELHLQEETAGAAAQIKFTNNNNSFEIGADANPQIFFINTTGNQGSGLCIDTSHNVGIGTSSPSYPLEVQSGGVGTVLRAGTSFISIDPTGSASAPSLIFNGDANTGIWRPASDTLAVSTAGSEKMRIGSTAVDVNVFLDLNDNYITGVNSYRNVAGNEIIDSDNVSYTIVKSYAGVNRLWLGETSTYANNNNFFFRDTGSNHLVTINADGLDIRSGGLDINSLEVIDSLRNLTNIGTISSGDITTTGIQMGTGASNDIQADGKTAYIGSAIFGNAASTNVPATAVHIKGSGTPTLRIEDLDSTNQVYDFITNFGVGLSIVDQTSSITPLAFAHTTGNATFSGTISASGDLTTTGINIGSNTGDAFNAQSVIRIQDGGNAYIQIKAGTSAAGGVLIGDTGDDFVGGFIYSNSTNALTFNSGNQLALTLDSSQNATFAGTIDSGNIYADYSLLGRGFRTANRGELHLNATGATDVVEMFFGFGDGYTDANIRWGISDRGSADDRLIIYRGPYHGGFDEVAYFDASARMVSSYNGYSVNGTTVIDNARNLDNINSIDVTSTTSGLNKFTFTDTNSNASFDGLTIDYNASGTQAHTADRTHRALYVDFDTSQTGGNTTDENRAYGIHVDVRGAGDTDLRYGVYSYSETQHSSGTVTSNIALYGFAVADDTSTGHTANNYGVMGLAYGYNTGTGGTTNHYGGYFKTQLTTANDKNTSTTHGIYAEVEIDNAGQAQTVTNTYGVRSVIDNDSAGNVTMTNAYLFHGDYQGTIPSGGYGLYIGDAVQNYVGGSFSAGSFIKNGGTDAQFLKADGSVQSSSAGSPQGTTSPFNASANTLTFLINVAHLDGLVTGSQTGVLDLSTGELEINSQGEINIKANSIEADKIAANTITGDEINTDLLNVKSFDNVSSTIKSHVTAGTKFPLARDGQAYVQRTGTYTGSNGSFVPVTITQVRDNAGYVAIFSGVLGDVSGGRVQYSLNNSTWVNANGNTNISWSAGTYRGYTYVYTGQITTLSTSQSTVYWRVYFSGSYNHTQLSLNVMMDNTR